MPEMKLTVNDKELSLTWDGSTLVVETYSAGPTIRIEFVQHQARQLSDWLSMNIQ